MSTDLAALGYLEYRQLVNRARHTLQQPSRAILYVLVFAYFIFMGYVRVRAAHGRIIPVVPEPYASALFFAYITLLGVMMYGAASGIVGAFSSAADARFLCGSLLPERLVIMWLQLRRSGTAIARMLFTILLYAMIFYHSGTFVGIGLAMMGGTIVATASAIPMLKLRLLIGTRTAQSLAGAVAAAGILPMAIALSSLLPGSVPPDTARAIEHLGAGYAFNALFNANALALLALYVFGALLIVLSYLCGTGLYADLYASSLRVIAFRERQKHSGTSFAVQHRYDQPAAAAPAHVAALFSGPWTIVWKEWMAFSRSSSMRRLFIFGVIVSVGVGAIFGQVMRSSKTPFDDAVMFASVAGNLIVVFVAIGSAVGLASDIAKPLWWMGPDPLWTRLSAWTVATSWRMIAFLVAGIVAWSITFHEAIIAVAGVPVAICLVLYLRAVGLALYSLFPSSIDQRGPMAMVRALVTYVLAAPPVVSGGVVLAFHPNQPAIAIAAGVLCSLIETLLLIAFASVRIAGQGVAFARAESF